MTPPLPAPFPAAPALAGGASAESGLGTPEVTSAYEAPAAPWPERSLRTDLALVFGLYTLLAWAAIVVARLPGTIAVVWVANGMALALILSAPAARTPALLGMTAAGNLTAHLAHGDALLFSLALLPPQVLEIALGVWLVRRTGLAARYAEDQRTFLWVMGVGALAPPLLSATLGAVTLQALERMTFARAWGDWYIGAALGAVAAVPIFLTLRAGPGSKALRRLMALPSVGTLALLVLVTIAAVRWLPYPFVAIGVVLVAVAFARPRAEAFAGAAVVVGTLAMQLGHGAMAVADSADAHALVFLSAMLTVLPAQVVAVAVARQRALSQTLAAVGSRTDDIVTFTDRDGVLRWVNQAREIYWGVPNAQVINRKSHEIVPASVWDGVAQPMFARTGRGEVVRQLVEMDYPGRGRRTMDMTTQPARDEDGQLLGVLYCASDVTELEASRRELQRSADALRVSHQSLEQFVRIASHDLREPLNTVTQFCSLIESQHAASLDAEAALYFSHVRAGTARMKQMMDDLLQYVRLDQGPPQTRQWVDLDALAREVCADLGARIEAQQARIDVLPLGGVAAHRSLLAVLLQNLLGNALKFVPQGRAPQVEVSARRQGGWLELTVADNGIGIEAARIDELGTPFRRLHARRKYEGTGLGLAICRRIAEQHGGRLQITSVVGVGSRFAVVLPDEPEVGKPG